jgi:hypothetical protein
MLRAAFLALAGSGLLVMAQSSVAAEPKPVEPSGKNPYPNIAPAANTPPAPVLSQEELEKQFAETMSGATMVGRYTQGSVGKKADSDKTDKPAADRVLKEDRYTLGKVAKLKDDYWLFETRIQYGDHDVTLPLTIQVKWAGDTAVITLTDVTVPGLGTFTSRVLVYRGQYAGTWSHGDHGGELFGKIIKPAK